MSGTRDHSLPGVRYLAFPFRMTATGGEQSSRTGHIREQIEQVLFTSPGERVFRPEWGFGARRLLFEPNSPALREVSRNRLLAALSEALAGEVDPKTLEADVWACDDAPERLQVRISYVLAAIRKRERQTFQV
jgi:hypothetical protein